MSPFCLLQTLLGQSGQCGLCVRGTLGHGGRVMTASSAHSPPAAGVFIFRLTLKHKAIHHRAPLRPGLGPRYGAEIRGYEARGRGINHGAH